MSKITIEVFDASKPTKSLALLENVSEDDSVRSLKQKVGRARNLGVERLSVRLEPRGKNVEDYKPVSDLNLPAVNAQIFVRDLGPQIAWRTVFLTEYAGPLFVYPIFYLRPTFIYGAAANNPISTVATIALILHSLHYVKRLYETVFVHRFSNGTMPIRNIFKNSGYYY